MCLVDKDRRSQQSPLPFARWPISANKHEIHESVRYEARCLGSIQVRHVPVLCELGQEIKHGGLARHDPFIFKPVKPNFLY
jgi:hypothetical protein